MLTYTQQSKAVTYSLIFLKNEIEAIEKTLENCTEQGKKLLLKRKYELEKDLEEFEKIADRGCDMNNEIQKLQAQIETLKKAIQCKNEQIDRLSQCNMNNSQALGYMMLACKKAEIPYDTAKKIRKEMYYMFDFKTEKEAEEQGLDCYNDEM